MVNADSDTYSNSSGAEQELLALRLARGVRRAFEDLGQACLVEFSLASGRRADVMAMDPKGRLSIVEIKSSLADFRSDGKWPEYRDYCDALYFAVAENFPKRILPEDCGLIVADAYGASILRPAPAHPLNAARRKAVTLRCAQVAARRLAAASDPR